jgi:hypothetical protein
MAAKSAPILMFFGSEDVHVTFEDGWATPLPPAIVQRSKLLQEVRDSSVRGTARLRLLRSQFQAWMSYLQASSVSASGLALAQHLVNVLQVCMLLLCECCCCFLVEVYVNAAASLNTENSHASLTNMDGHASRSGPVCWGP